MCGGKAPLQRRQTRSARGGNCDGFVTNPAGWLTFNGAPGPILKPHRPQNLECCGSGLEQRGHGNESGDSPGLTRVNDRLPQRPQNFTPSANRELQLVHATIPGITLEWIPLLLLPWDGDGLLPASIRDLRCAWMT